MARRSDHTREELKEMAIRAAEQLIEREGSAGMSARKVAAEMGYTAGTLYLIFKNIDELIVEVNRRTLRQLELQIESDVRGESDPVASIVTIARTYLNYAQGQTHRWLAVFEHRLPEDKPFPEAYLAQVARLFALVEEPLRTIHGVEAAEIDIAREARALWAGVHGLATLTVGGKLVSQEVDPDEILRVIVERIAAPQQ